IGEDAKLGWRLDGVAQTETGDVAKRDQRATDDRQQTERARFLPHDFGAGNQECLSEFLVLREAQSCPRGGNCQIDERGTAQIGSAAPRLMRANFVQAGKGSGDEAEGANHSERLEREKPEQRSNDTERSQPGTDHVIAINSRDVVREGSESEPNA